MKKIERPAPDVAIVTVPLSIAVTVGIAKRSQPQFIEQWAATGRLNAHIEEMYTGHTLVKVYGHQQAAIEDFDRENDALYRSSFKAQFISGTIVREIAILGGDVGKFVFPSVERWLQTKAQERKQQAVSAG